MQKTLLKLTYFLWICSIMLLGIGLLSPFYWLFDLISSFTLQLSIATVFFSIILIFKKKYLVGGIAIVLVLLNFLRFLPNDIRTEEIADRDKLTFASMNLLSTNFNSAEVVDYIKALDADVVLILEYTNFWDQALKEGIGNDYSYSVNKIQDDNFGIALFSKHRMLNYRIMDFTNSYFPMVNCKIDFKGTSLNIFGVHLENPMGPNNHKVRSYQIQQSINHLKNMDDVIFIGDFNMTPYSNDFQRIESKLNLTDTRHSIGASWPSFFWPLQIPIDHCFISPSFKLINRTKGPSMGSDHYPIIIELGI